MSLDVEAWVTVFGVGVAQPYAFAGYILDVIGESSNGIQTADAIAWKAYPNPVQDQLIVETPSTNAFIQVHNLAGQSMPLLTNVQNNRVTIETSHWPNGLYFVSHQDAAGMSTRRVVVQH
jgi:hypothetical protein